VPGYLHTKQGSHHIVIPHPQYKKANVKQAKKDGGNFKAVDHIFLISTEMRWNVRQPYLISDLEIYTYSATSDSISCKGVSSTTIFSFLSLPNLARIRSKM